MRASTMAEFWTRCGRMVSYEVTGLTVTWHYEHGAADFDGSKWNFLLNLGVRK